MVAILGGDLNIPAHKKDVILSKERSRILELEASIRAVEAENTSLSEQVQYWTKSSKKNQETRLTVDACKQALEQEVQDLKTKIQEISSASSKSDYLNRINELEQKLYEKQVKLQSSEATLASAKAKISDFEVTLEESYAVVDAMERENEDIRMQLDIKEQVVLELREQVVLFMEETMEMPNKSSKSLSNMPGDDELSSASKNRSLDVLQMELKREKNLLAEQLEKVNSSLSALDQKHKDLLKRYENLKTEHSKCEQTQAGLQTQINELQETNQELEWELVELKAHSITPNAARSLKTTEPSAQMEALGKDSGAFNDLLEKSETLKKSLSQKDSEVSALKRQLSKMEEQGKELQEAVDQLNYLQQELENQDAEIKNQQSVTNVKDRKLRETLQHLKFLEQTLQEKEAEVEQIRSQHEQLQSLGNTASEEKDRIQQELSALKETVQYLEVSFFLKSHAFKSKCQTLTKDANDLPYAREQVEELTTMLEKLDAENANLRQQINECMDKMADLEISASSADQSLLEKTQRLSNDLMSKEEEIMEKNEQIESLQNQVASLGEVIETREREFNLLAQSAVTEKDLSGSF